MKIGYYVNDYLTKRLVLGKIKNADYIRIFGLSRLVYFILRVLKKIGFKKLDKVIFNCDYSFFGRVWGGGGTIAHFFNHIYLYSDIKWISQFETILPRYRNPSIKAIKAMTDKNCLAVLPISKCAYNMEMNMLENFSAYKEVISQKMQVLHPPQELLISDITQKKKNDKLTFCFVGNDFFRKAGMEMLYAFDKLTDKSNIELIVISNMNINDFVTHSNEQIKKQALNFFSKNSNYLKFYNGLPNDKVLAIIRKSDIGLLPTKQDTYGFSLLEMQAAGVPVISTDVRALPEINNDECGWLIPVAKDKFGEAFYANEQELEHLSIEIKNGLYKILTDILKEYSISGINFIRKKGENALNRIAKEHNPKSYGKFLELAIRGENIDEN